MVHPTHQPGVRRTLLTLALFGLILVLVRLSPAVPGSYGLASYLPLHTALETFAVVVAAMVFGVGWRARHHALPVSVQVLACLFLGVALLDFSHMLAYQGMPHFVTPSGPEKAINFWLAARLLAALGLLAAAFLPWSSGSTLPRAALLSGVLGSVIALHGVFLFAPHWVPRTFVAGEGLTTFKVAAEYMLIALYLVAAAGFWRHLARPRHFDAGSFFGAAVLMAQSELFFTFYSDVTDIYNLAGHVYKIVAYYYLYRAVFVETVDQPYRTLSASQANLRALSEELDAERARLGNIVRGTHAGTWEWNVQTGETRFNERWAQIAGYRLDELQPVSIETWMRLAHPDDLARSNALLERHFAGLSDVYDCEVRMRHKLGHWIWVHDLGVVQEWTEDGKPLWMFGTHIDVTDRREAERLNAELLARLQALSANVPGVLYQFRRRPDGTYHFPYASDRLLKVYGCRPSEVEDDASPVFRAVHPDDVPRIVASIEASFASLHDWHASYRVIDPGGGERWVEGRASPCAEADGGVLWHGYIHDITEQHSARERLKLAAIVFEASQQGIMITDAERRIIDVNPAFLRMSGYTREEIVGQTPGVLRSGLHDEQFYAEMDARLAAEGRWTGEVWNHHKQGGQFVVLLSISAVRGGDGSVTHYVALSTDIALLKHHEEELRRIAYHDPLTGISNRRMLTERLEQAVLSARATGDSLAVCLLDLDGFKPVNDRLGHAAGDRLLVELAQRLKEVVRGDETVARLGGDEFVLVFRDLHSPAPFERVLNAVRKPVDIGDAVVTVSGSLGVAWLRDDVADGEQLLREADQALYRAKAEGRDRYAEFPLPDGPAAAVV